MGALMLEARLKPFLHVIMPDEEHDSPRPRTRLYPEDVVFRQWLAGRMRAAQRYSYQSTDLSSHARTMRRQSSGEPINVQATLVDRGGDTLVMRPRRPQPGTHGRPAPERARTRCAGLPSARSALSAPAGRTRDSSVELRPASVDGRKADAELVA
jgi:hypothetical protein